MREQLRLWRHRLLPAGGVEPITDPQKRRLLTAEIIIVLAVTFGLSGVYAILNLTAALLDPQPLADQTAALNSARYRNGALDVAYQLAGIARLLAWAALPLVLLAHSGIGPRVIGLVRDRPARQLGAAISLTALIGIPGLVFYFASLATGFNLRVEAAGLPPSWWQPLVLIGKAFANGAAEEVLVVGYLLYRLAQLGWSPLTIVVASATLRSSYHLYQGFGGGAGNFAMGIVFAIWWWRTRRLWPLIGAHTLLDVFAFLGYALLADHLP